jgi:hypothetical protein
VRARPGRARARDRRRVSTQTRTQPSTRWPSIRSRDLSSNRNRRYGGLVRKSWLVLFTCLGSCGLLWASSATEASPGATTQCGFVHASVPYSHRGHHDRWRVYAQGNASCAAARGVLSAVLHLNAAAHYGSDNANSYFTYRGWTCDFGQMGFQSCWRPRHRPYQAGALALDCVTASGGCPARIPNDYLP